jgi:hypothetical protein
VPRSVRYNPINVPSVAWCCRGALAAKSWPRRCLVAAHQHRPPPFPLPTPRMNVAGPSRHAMWLSLRAVDLVLSRGAGSQVPSPADTAATASLAGQPAVSTPSQVAHQCVRCFPFPSPPFGPGTNLSITFPPDSQMAWNHHPHDRKPAHPASTCTHFSPTPGYTTLPSLTTWPSHPPHAQS